MIVVTGAFGYSGSAIAARFLDAGHTVRTLTNSPERPNPFGGRIEAHPFNFDHPDTLAESLRGAEVLINTYWVRFNHTTFTHGEATENTQRLFEAAASAGVGRVVHVSITNASEASPLEYFSAKGRLERALRESGLPHSILRPAVLFGGHDILVNNIAWALRRMPVFGVFGDGRYRLQPIYVGDFADLAMREAAASGNRVVDSIGPETFTYRGLVGNIAASLGLRRVVVGVPPAVGYVAGRLAGAVVGDKLITREEIEGLMAGLLCTDSPPAGTTRLTEWARANRRTLGLTYASELARRRDRRLGYCG
jgi:NADH dehydrogenase